MNDLVGLALKAPVDDALSQLEEVSLVKMPSSMLPPGY
jgi:hypothetical protein